MQKNRISAVITAEQEKEYTEKLQSIINALDFKVIVTDVDRRRASHIGLTRAQQAIALLETLREDPRYLPVYMNISEYEKDYNLYRVMTSLRMTVQSLLDLISRNLIALSEDLTSGMSTTMDSFKAAAKNGQPMAGELLKRIQRFRRKRTIEEKEENEAESKSEKKLTQQEIPA